MSRTKESFILAGSYYRMVPARTYGGRSQLSRFAAAGFCARSGSWACHLRVD